MRIAKMKPKTRVRPKHVPQLVRVKVIRRPVQKGVHNVNR